MSKYIKSAFYSWSVCSPRALCLHHSPKGPRLDSSPGLSATPVASRGRAHTERSPRRNCGRRQEVPDAWVKAPGRDREPAQGGLLVLAIHPLISAAKEKPPRMLRLSLARWEGEPAWSMRAAHVASVSCSGGFTCFFRKGRDENMGSASWSWGFPAGCQVPAPDHIRWFLLSLLVPDSHINFAP